MKRINGLMIDCSRLIEPEDYYYRLVEFMARWGMNTLLWHFSDDYGCSLRLPGYEHLAMPNAFTAGQMRKLIVFAGDRGIDVIPELETFGHTRYVSDLPQYRYLFHGRRVDGAGRNALDPLHPDSHALMAGLIRAVADMFPSSYLHLGCDEVDLEGYCRRRNLRAGAVWADYVNNMISHAREAGKTPMVWADHVAGSDAAACRLRKDVILVCWDYVADAEDSSMHRLRKAGFRDIVMAPSLACVHHRFLPSADALENTRRMIAIGKRHKAGGVINTVWCPWRYLQNAMYYGIAYSACAARKGAPPDQKAFDRRFAREVFGTRLEPELQSFLECWNGLAIDEELSRKILQRDPSYTTGELARLREMNRAGERIVRAHEHYTPRENRDIWDAMVLAAYCTWLCSESILLRRTKRIPPQRKAQYNRLLQWTRHQFDAEWDRTRDPGDPQKFKPRFRGSRHGYARALLHGLSRIR